MLRPRKKTFVSLLPDKTLNCTFLAFQLHMGFQQKINNLTLKGQGHLKVKVKFNVLYVLFVI